MRVGIGIPNAVPGVEAAQVAPWAKRAEEVGFSSLGVVDRIRYDALEPMSVLAAAGAATSSIGLVTMVVISPLRQTAVLAKQAASLDHMSRGRFTLGVGAGARTEDYHALQVPARDRGMRLSEQLVELRALWRDPAFGPLTSRYGPQVVVGGMSDMTFARAARHTDGYVHGGGPPRTFATAAEKMRRAWLDHGRLGEPRLWAQAYFALGDTAVRDRGREYLLDYYAFTGPFAATIARALLATPQSIAAFLRGYAQAGCEELVLLPAVPDPDQVDRLAAVIEEDADLLVPV